MPGGRPTKLLAKVQLPVGRDGDTLTVTVAEAIHRRIRATGTTPSLAGKMYLVAADTVWDWIEEGRRQQKRQADGRLLNAQELRLISFVQGCDRAHAEYMEDQQELMNRLAEGGIITGKVVETIDPTRKADGTPMTAADPPNAPRFVVDRKVTTDRTLPDFKAVKFNLERKGKRDGFAPSMEIFEGPTPDDDGEGARRQEREAELLAQIQVFKEGVEAGVERERERAAEDVATVAGDVGAVDG